MTYTPEALPEIMWEALAESLAPVALRRVIAKHPGWLDYSRGKQANLVRLEVRWLLSYLQTNGVEMTQGYIEQQERLINEG